MVRCGPSIQFVFYVYVIGLLLMSTSIVFLDVIVQQLPLDLTTHPTATSTELCFIF